MNRVIPQNCLSRCQNESVTELKVYIAAVSSHPFWLARRILI